MIRTVNRGRMIERLHQHRNLINVTLSDFIVRSAYQMGKTPLLPIFAASLGATGALLGFIVSVSTLTGMILKPFIGILSDRWGRRWWLIVGGCFFAGMPFLYRFVHTPEQLFVIRIVHGTATAIYGPVTLAYVVELSRQHRAERLGWFEMARSGGYIVGPYLAGLLLLTMDPVDVFTVIGLMSALAFIPILRLRDVRPPAIQSPANLSRPSIIDQVQDALKAGSRTPAIWLSGCLEAIAYVALYAVKAFLPLFALSIGIRIDIVGLYFSVQEGVVLLLKPFAGRVGDRIGYLNAIAPGMGLIGLALILLPSAQGAIPLLAVAVCSGIGQALVYPSTLALISDQIDEAHVGAGMGLAGSLENAGKVIGPILGGVLLASMAYGPMFRWLGGMLVVAGVLVGVKAFSDRPDYRSVPIRGEESRK